MLTSVKETMDLFRRHPLADALLWCHHPKGSNGGREIDRPLDLPIAELGADVPLTTLARSGGEQGEPLLRASLGISKWRLPVQRSVDYLRRFRSVSKELPDKHWQARKSRL